MNYPIYFLLLFATLLFGQETRGRSAEFWIIENPSALVLYNQYEQRLSQAEKSVLPVYSAWRIIETEHILSDQFTKTAKTEINHRIFYIQLSDNNQPVNKFQAGHIDVIKKALIQGDTLLVKTSGKISLQQGSESTELLQGVLIECLFKHRNTMYGRDLTSNKSGWILGNTATFLEHYVPANTDLALEKQLFTRVDQIVMSVNTRLEKLFSFLNKYYKNSKTIPKWVAEKSPMYLKYTLSPTSYQKNYPDSQSYLVQELKDLLYGSSYQLSATDGQIVIIKATE